MKNKISRRNFFGGLFTTSAILTSTKAGSSPKKVKMLTPEGKLVTINEQVLEGSDKIKVNNRQIFDWAKNLQSKKP